MGVPFGPNEKWRLPIITIYCRILLSISSCFSCSFTSHCSSHFFAFSATFFGTHPYISHLLCRISVFFRLFFLFCSLFWFSFSILSLFSLSIFILLLSCSNISAIFPDFRPSYRIFFRVSFSPCFLISRGFLLLS